VLVVTAIASLAILPDARWANTFQQLIASAAYVENWVLAHNAVDYLLPVRADSPVQHFWSLSVEEQFYAFWPLLIIVAVWVMTRIRRTASTAARRRAVIVTLSTLVLAPSLTYSIYETAVAPKTAYFVTPTRVWEFAVGALCALLVSTGRPGSARGSRSAGSAWRPSWPPPSST
jgi:peptidoglycan/LPS O-acetylase OafA/YrhL